MPTDEAVQWLRELKAYALDLRKNLMVPDGHDLDPLSDWQRRVSGGVLLQFLEFIQTSAPYEHFPQLDDRPLADRVFLFITDLSGLVAGHELLDPDAAGAFAIRKQEWRAWLSAPDTDHDDDFDRHYESWSAWHQNLHSEWEIPEDEAERFWVHEEGFALADQAGRGAQHLWRWDGQRMEKVEEAITSWKSTGDD